MQYLIKTLIILCFVLPHELFAKTSCETKQQAESFHENYWNSKPKWICPGGKLIISFSDKSHAQVSEFVNLQAAEEGNVNLTIEKYDPHPHQIHFEGKKHKVHTVSISASPGAVHLPKMITGDLKSGGAERTITITNNSSGKICLSGSASCK